MARTRTGGAKFRTKTSKEGEQPKYITQNGGTLLTTDWEGNYSYLCEVDTDMKGEDGYPIRARLEKAKFVARDKAGKVLKTINMDMSRTFINIIAWEDMPKRPPREDG